MRCERSIRWSGRIGLLTTCLVIGGLTTARAQDSTPGEAKPATAAKQDPAQSKPSMEIYGFAMLDIGHDFKTINPNWSDTLRVTRLPSFDGEFGEPNNTFAGVRQSRLGVRATLPTDLGDLKTTFEFELFGTGVDEGQTTFRLRHAYGELAGFGAGQYWSPFMDIDVFPNTLEYWGPTGMVFFRNVHVRYMPPLADGHSAIIALERPGASGDQGIYEDRVELDGIRARFPVPDLSAAYKYTRDWGYLRAAGMLRYITWDDLRDDEFDLAGNATGWGFNLSSNYKPTDKDVLRFQFVFGEGIQNYMNDTPTDIGIVNNFGDAARPILGKTIPITGLVLFLDHTWNPKFSSSVGYSRQDNDNREGQAPNAFRDGQYALGNLLFYPAANVMMGGELQWGRRESFDGFQSDGFKIQFSFKYNFSQKIGG
jgi:hypothetical protein